MIINRSRIFILLFFITIISLRIILETAVFSDRLNFYLFLHHFAWFVSVFILFALIARYLIGVPPKKLHYIFYASPVILLPMVHAWIAGGSLHLRYLRGDISNILFNMMTFNLFHPQNFVQSSVLIVTFLLICGVALFYRKKLLVSLVISLSGYVIFYLSLGVQWFGIAPNTKAIFAINTTLSNHQLLAVIYISVAVIESFILFLPELRTVKDRK